MAFIDYYKVMGIPKDTPQSEIRAAYRKRSKQFHPDIHPDDPKAKAKFQLLNEAYEVLNDPDKRAKYDTYGEQWKNAAAYENMGGAQGFGGNAGGFDMGNGGFNFNFGGGGFSDFFEQMFGGARRSSHCSGGCGKQEKESHADVEIDMYTALLGGDLLIQTPNAKIKLKVKPGTQPSSKTRLRGKGEQRPDGSFNDLILTFNVKLPTNLTERQKQLLEEMRRA